MTGIERIDPFHDEALRDWFAVERASIEHDRPQAVSRSLAALADARRHPDAYHDVHLLAVRVAGEIAGIAELGLSLRDNLHLAELEIHVRPQHRRRGIGRALHDAADALRRRAGRDTVLAELSVPWGCGDPPGRAFALALGFESVHVEHHLVRDLPVAAREVAALRRPTDGHEIVTWGRRCPDELRPAFCRMRTQMENDVPIGEVAYAPVVVDEARLAHQEERTGRSYLQVAAAARDLARGELVAYSLLFLAREGDQVIQDDTLVMPEHRGNGLGLQLKLATLDVIQRDHPERRTLHTWTDPGNAAMYAVNRRFGYRPAETLHELQRRDAS
jgi:GNAT superfamily N-acetyltransferase